MGTLGLDRSSVIERNHDAGYRVLVEASLEAKEVSYVPV